MKEKNFPWCEVIYAKFNFLKEKKKNTFNTTASLKKKNTDATLSKYKTKKKILCVFKEKISILKKKTKT